MKIVDTFPFSEIHETDLLWLKLNLGKDIVNEWVIVENDYTFQGEYKGFCAEETINSSKRFSEFKDKITILQGSYQSGSKNENLKGDQLALKAEEYTRELARDHIIASYEEEDVVIISDVDEMPDFNDPDRREKMVNSFELMGDIVRLPRVRFWYDYDNLWYAKRATPAIKVKHLLKPNTLAHIRRNNIDYSDSQFRNSILVFEYSFCFDLDGIIRKYDTFGHVGTRKQDILLGLKCNTLVNSRDVHDYSPYYWLEKVKLDKSNSPKFVRDNYSTLKTESVDVNYKTNRKIHYPKIFPSKFPFTIISAIKRSRMLRTVKRKCVESDQFGSFDLNK